MHTAKVGIVGLGQMGLGISEAFSQKGFCVVGADLGHDLVSLEDCDLVIEAITEDAEAKKAIFGKLEKIVKKDAIFASNTSSISISLLASSVLRKDKFIGMHFMNPVPVMKLVEIIKGHQTSLETEKIIQDIAKSLDKITTVSEDYPGFIANRILMPMINEAFYALMEGVASKEDIDTTMKFGCNFPMGPLKLADLIGLDVCLAILEVLHKGFGQDKYAPCPLLRRYVQAGNFGRKTKRGVYVYGL